jgi:predicted nucleic acid-binding protein
VVIVETSVWIDYIREVQNGPTEWLRGHLDSDIGLTDLTLCEVLQGTRSAASFSKVRTHLMLFPVVPAGGTWMALAAAQNYRTLRDRGTTVRKTIDCLIATCCIENDYSLLHRDRDFDGFEKHLGLRVIHP